MEANICGSVCFVVSTVLSETEFDVVSFVLVQLTASNTTKLIAKTGNRFFISECFIGKSQNPTRLFFLLSLGCLISTLLGHILQSFLETRRLFGLLLILL